MDISENIMNLRQNIEKASFLMEGKDGKHHVMLEKWLDANFDKKKKYFTVGKEKSSLDEFVWKGNDKISFSEYEKGLLHYFCEHGIDKFYKIHSSDDTASIGFSDSEQKWYGWSHRAIYGFGIGEKIKKGNCAYVDHPYTCKTLEQCRKAAEDFAKDVS